jgi:hypothetical protein
MVSISRLTAAQGGDHRGSRCLRGLTKGPKESKSLKSKSVRLTEDQEEQGKLKITQTEDEDEIITKLFEAKT